MIDPGIFQEIEEDLQRQKYEKLWKQYGNYIIAFVIAIVLITAVISGWKSWVVYSQQKASDALLGLVEGKFDDKTRQIERLEEFAKTYAGTSQSVLARLNAGSMAIRDGKKEKGIAIYESLAADENVEIPFRQLATLLSVQAQMDSGKPAELKSKLSSLLENSAWSISAKEFYALLSIRAGEKEEAKKIYTELANSTNIPSSISKRAGDMLRWLNEGS